MKRNLILAAAILVSLTGALALAQMPAPSGPMSGDMKGMADMKQEMSPEMKAMMEKMPPEIKMRCQMMMGTEVSPSDPAAILALKEQLKLTEAQTSQLEAINKEAQDKAIAVLTADQKTILDTMPKSTQTMKEMHEQMMGKMQKMMGGKMGDQRTSCPMMNMMGGSTTQPAQDKLADPKSHEAHH